MKKWIAVLMSLMLLLGAVPAMAEEAESDFNQRSSWIDYSAWICDRAFIEVGYQDDDVKVSVSWASSAFESSEWTYHCDYDEETNTLTSYAGYLETWTFSEDGELVDAREIYDDGEATFTINENGHLIWHDAKENAGDGMEFEPASLRPAADDLSLLDYSVWACDRASMEIGTVDDTIKVAISWADSADQTYEWTYHCDYDEETGTLKSTSGSLSVWTYNDSGELIDDQEVYTDGQATFTFTEYGTLLWDDAKENAGDGMVFVLMEY